MERGANATHHVRSVLEGGASGTVSTSITAQRPKPPGTQTHLLLDEQTTQDRRFQNPPTKKPLMDSD